MHDLAAVTLLDEIQTDWKHRAMVSCLPIHNSRAMIVVKRFPPMALLGQRALWVDAIISPPATAVVELVFACRSRGAPTQFPEAVPFEIEVVSSSTPIKNCRCLPVFQGLKSSCELLHDGKPA